MAYRPRRFKPLKVSGRQTVTPFTRKEVDDLRILCKRKRDEASNKVEPESRNPHWSEKFMWDRNLMLIDLGLNSALRIEDLVQLRVSPQLRKGYIDTKEFKTGRYRSFQLNSRMTKDLQDYIERYNLVDGEYLFTSRKGFNRPITRQQAYLIIKDLANELGIVRKIGCHSLRKTYGRLYYEATKDLVGLHQILHSGKGDPTVTLIYIGMIESEVAAKRQRFDI